MPIQSPTQTPSFTFQPAPTERQPTPPRASPPSQPATGGKASTAPRLAQLPTSSNANAAQSPTPSDDGREHLSTTTSGSSSEWEMVSSARPGSPASGGNAFSNPVPATYPTYPAYPGHQPDAAPFSAGFATAGPTANVVLGWDNTHPHELQQKLMEDMALQAFRRSTATPQASPQRTYGPAYFAGPTPSYPGPGPATPHLHAPSLHMHQISPHANKSPLEVAPTRPPKARPSQLDQFRSKKKYWATTPALQSFADALVDMDSAEAFNRWNRNKSFSIDSLQEKEKNTLLSQTTKFKSLVVGEMRYGVDVMAELSKPDKICGEKSDTEIARDIYFNILDSTWSSAPLARELQKRIADCKSLADFDAIMAEGKITCDSDLYLRAKEIVICDTQLLDEHLKPGVDLRAVLREKFGLPEDRLNDLMKRLCTDSWTSELGKVGWLYSKQGSEGQQREIRLSLLQMGFKPEEAQRNAYGICRHFKKELKAVHPEEAKLAILQMRTMAEYEKWTAEKFPPEEFVPRIEGTSEVIETELKNLREREAR